MRALSGLSRVITGTAAIAVVIGMASAGGAALAATNGHGSAARTAGVTAPAAITHPAQAPVSSPGILAPPDVVVGGNPARVVKQLKAPEAAVEPSADTPVPAAASEPAA